MKTHFSSIAFALAIILAALSFQMPINLNTNQTTLFL